MNIIQIICSTAYVILGIIDCLNAETGKSRFAKPLLMPCLIMVLMQSREPHMLIAAGLFCGWLGDIALMFHGKKAFIAGLTAFLCGHIFYSICFFVMPQASQLLYVFPALLFYALISRMILPKLLPLVRGKLKVPVTVYTFVIQFMSFCAFLYDLALPSAGRHMILFGSLFFIVSDTILAFCKFTGHRQHYVMETYLAAQALICFGYLIHIG